MRSRFHRHALLLSLLLGTSATSALAATQGTIGATSTGTVVITASLGAHVSISGLSDITFSDTDLTGLGAASKHEDVCAWSNNADRSYFVTASGSGAGGEFLLTDTVDPDIPYDVRWNELVGQTTGTTLTAGTKSPRFTSAATVPDCGGGSSASLIVRIRAQDAATMVATGVYTGTLTLLLTPT
jgi:hypothetical protein